MNLGQVDVFEVAPLCILVSRQSRCVTMKFCETYLPSVAAECPLINFEEFELVAFGILAIEFRWSPLVIFY